MSDTHTQETPSSLSENEEFNRLFWHCRRGMLELDVLLVPFLKEAYRDLPQEDKVLFSKLIENEDPDLFSWFLRNGEPKDAGDARMVRIILDRVQLK